nr:peptidoglycan DD-metalloendopeptidase family protein [Pseudoglutamicibacter cumminsii]
MGTALFKGFGRLQSLENAKAKLTGLGHSAKTVEGIMSDANKAVKGTAFGMDEAATTAAGAVAAGIKPGKDLEAVLRLTGDAATIAGTDMASMGAIFNKVATSNKVQGDVINQLNERGIPIIQLLSEELGVSAEETVKLASKGQINFETFRKAMEKGVGGAAAESGKTLQGAFKNAGAALGRFGANLLSGVYPKVRDFFTGFIAWMEPLEEHAKRIGSVLGDFIVTAVEKISAVAVPIGRALIDGLKNVATWVRENWDLVKVLGIAVGAAAGAVGLIVAAQRTWAAVTRGLAAAQTLLNTVMNASPLKLIVGAIAAVVAGLVAFFTQTETGRKAWERISAAFTGFISGVAPVFRAVIDGIKNAIGVMGSVFASVGNAIKTGWQAVGAVFRSVWQSFVSPVFAAFRSVFQALYNGVVKPVANGIKAVWRGVGSVVRAVWQGTVSGVFNLMRNGVSAVGKAFSVAKGTISTVWNAVKGIASGVWNSVKGSFGLMKGGVKGIGKAFEKARDAIRTAWNMIKGIAAKPINFVIDTVYNNGIRKVVGAVGKLVGMKTPDRIPKIKGYAKGGRAPKGWAIVGEEGPELVNFTHPGRVYTAAETQAMLTGGEQAPLDALDFLVGPKPSTSMVAAGGLWEDIKNGAKAVGNTLKQGWDKVTGWARGKLRDTANVILKPIRALADKFIPKQGFAEFINRFVHKSLDNFLDWLGGEDKKAEAEEAGGSSPGEYKGKLPGGRLMRPSRGPFTSMYGPRWGSFHAGVDIAGGGPTYAAADGKVSKVGWNVVPGRTGIGIVLSHGGGMYTYYGHNPVGGVRVRPGDTVKRGQHIGAQGATGNVTGVHLHFEVHRGGIGRNVNPMPYLHDNGGWLKPGLSTIMNATRKPEAILNPSQWRAAQRAINHTINNNQGGVPSVVNVRIGEQEFTGYVEGITDGRLSTHARGARRITRQFATA